MPLNAFQKLLQMEIRIPRAHSVEGSFKWYREGLAIALPKFFTHSGWRAKAIQITTDRNGHNSFFTVEQSRFGFKRKTEASNDNGNLPIEVVIPDDLIFESKVKLPLAAAKSLANTIGLRLGEISPIPPGDAAFSVNERTHIENDRIEARVAIVRKKTLLDFRKGPWGKRITTIGAQPNDKGKFKFIFERSENAAGINRSKAIDIALIGAAILMLFAAIDGNLTNRLQNLEQYEAAILSELRLTRESTALFDEIEPTDLEQRRGEYSKSVSRDLQAALAALPDGILIDNLDFQPDILTLSGFMPSDLDKSRTPNLQITGPSSRPGFDKFTMRNEQGNSP